MPPMSTKRAIISHLHSLGRRGRDSFVVGFTITYAISANHN